MINSTSIQGRFVKDIELKTTGNGKSFCSFTIACDRGYKDESGNMATDWIDCVAWGKTAEFISKYFHKGDMTVMLGGLRTRTYEDKEGKKHKVTEVNITEAAFCGKRDKADNTQSTYQEIEDDDEGLPF